MNPPPDETTERILGLDPRALLARARTPERSPARAAWSPPELEELAPLLPGFVLEEFIGRGGMGAVYRARQAGLERAVAIKLLPRTAAEDAEFAERFRTEARALARLQHPHIVTIYESGATTDGHLFYVMEYVDGSDLSELLAHGALPAAQALSIARAVCEALEYAHARGIIHRDIKPANVLLGDDGLVKVADFGLAKQFSGPERTENLTVTGAALGTPSYMSPEQRKGQPVDARADLYSLGVMLYEMLTGELPQGAWQPPSRKSDSSPRLDAVVEKSVQPDPALRVQSAAELRARLERIERLMAPGVRRRRVILTAAAALALSGGGAWLWRLPPRAVEAPVLLHDAQTTRSAPSIPPLLEPGTYHPLENLNLASAALSGQWSWLDDKPGGTLSIAYTHEQRHAKILHLPVHPGPRGYDVTCELLVEHRGGDMTFLLPAGTARPALVFDLYDYTGLEVIRGTNWKQNETSRLHAFPSGRFVPVVVVVRPSGDRVAISLHLDGQPVFQWEGLQSDLTLLENDYPQALVNHRGPVLSLFSSTGAAQLRALEVKVLP